MKDSKILILGANGMVGRMVYLFLKNKYPDNIYKTTRKEKDSFYLNPKTLTTNLRKIYKTLGRIDYIINCIGITDAVINKKSDVMRINSLFPNKLQKLSKKFDFTLIQISSDAVFDKTSGGVTEKNIPVPDDLYGISKLLGETKNYSITIRSSFVGFSPIKKTGLFEWVKKSKKTISGFTNQSWSGCTTLQFAKLCKFLIFDNGYEEIVKKTNVIHFAPLGPTAKYNLVSQAASLINKKIKVEKANSPITVTRYLKSIYFDKVFLKPYTTNLSKALKELIKFENEI